MTFSGRTLYLLRTAPLLAGFAILALLYALLVPVVPVQVYTPLDNCVLCPLVPYHSQHVPGGYVTAYLYSVSRLLTGFGSFYNVDEGYVLPSGLQFQQGMFLTGFGVFLFILLPLSLMAASCFAITQIIRRKQRVTSSLSPVHPTKVTTGTNPTTT